MCEHCQDDLTVAAKQFPLVPLEKPIGNISSLKTELRVYHKIQGS